MLMTQATNHKRGYNYDDNYLHFTSNNTSTSVGLDYEDTMATKRIKSGTGIGTALPPKVPVCLLAAFSISLSCSFALLLSISL